MRDKIKNLLNDIDLLFKDFYKWLAGQYDYKIGGFYYARSSKTDKQFKPDIESTAQALHILQKSNLIINMPECIKEKIILFFKKRQDPETGFFYDSQNEMRKFDRMIARALSYSIGALKHFNAKPLYPVPGSNGIKTLPEYLKSKEKLIKWLKSRDWSNSWMACDNISAAGIYFFYLPKKEQKEYIDIVWDFLEKMQDPETGMWGKGRPYIKISGAFKLSRLYNIFNKKIPRADKIYSKILTTLKDDISEDICWTRNPVDLLFSIKHYIDKLQVNDIYDIISITYNNLKEYLKEDGGFSRNRDKSLAIPNNVILGKGLAEGDMNASTQALRTRYNCYYIAEEKPKHLKEYMINFYDNLKLAV